MATNLDQLYGASGDVQALETKVNNLSQIAVKNNIADQRIPQQRISQAPSNEEHIVRLADTRYLSTIQHTGNWTGEGTFTPTSGRIAVNNAYECIGQVIIGGDDLCFSCGLVIGSNNNYAHSATIYLTVGNTAQETLILRMRYQNSKFWIRRLGTYTGDIAGFRLWTRKVNRL